MKTSSVRSDGEARRQVGRAGLDHLHPRRPVREDADRRHRTDVEAVEADDGDVVGDAADDDAPQDRPDVGAEDDQVDVLGLGLVDDERVVPAQVAVALQLGGSVPRLTRK